MVLLVNLQMLGQIRDAVGEQADLDLGGTGVGLVHLELLDQFLFVFG
jgi:hypothetical protein